MTAEQFITLQQYLIGAFWPFIRLWIVGFLVLGISVALIIPFLSISRELLTRVEI